MSRRYTALLVDDMLDCIEAIENATKGMDEDEILASRLHKDAIIRNLEVLGEAANQLTKEVHALVPEIPWARVISLRNRLIHEYHGVNWKVILPIIIKELPLLKSQLQKITGLLPEQVDFKKSSE
ncbi:MAG: DUF86 domain-containing protein [Candidatus Melainabacteria bacterium]|nr:DUF86 domain-containing protein [Candidatus Melainabacteria bacterium]